MQKRQSAAAAIPSPGVDDFIAFAQSLSDRCAPLNNVQGIRKLERKLKAEMRFLNNLKQESATAQRSQLNSSNLSQLSSVVHAAERVKGVTNVLKKFHMAGRAEGVLVDVVAAGGHSWIKVIARKAEALHCVWAGQGQFGDRNLMLQADEFLECARCHPHNFTTPQVHFAFYNEVTEPMSAALVSRGVSVWGVRVPVSEELSRMISLHLAQDSGSSSGFDSDEDDDDGLGIHAYADLYDHDLELKEDYDIDNSSSKENRITSTASQNQNSFNNPSKNNISQDLPKSNVLSACQEKSPAKDSSAALEYKSVANSLSQRLTASDGSLPSDTMCEGQSQGCVAPRLSESHQFVDVTDVFHYLVTSPPDLTSSPLTAPAAPSSPDAPISKANLDITSLITLVSNISHGGCTAHFTDAVLLRQAEEERQEPVLPLMQGFLKDKSLMACQSAVTCFQALVDLMGGPGEQRRTRELLGRLQVVPDQPSPRALGLTQGGKVKVRSKVIFGTGDSLEAITVTSNMGFVRAAQNQGVVFPAFLHSARALTEMKENGGSFVKTLKVDGGEEG